MSDLDNILGRHYKTNVSNYSGVFATGNNYQKFDFVYNTGDGEFYYARQDTAAYMGAVSVNENLRYTLIPDGPATSDGLSHYILDGLNRPHDISANFEAGQIINLNGSTGSNDGQYKILSIEESTTVNNQLDLTGAAIMVLGISSSSIDHFEPSGSHAISLEVVDSDPSLNPDAWTSDLFFFDADYGATVNFKANNHRYQYGNGYYILQPKNINSLSCEFDLKFQNRTNREANALIHFLENKQGQQEKDKSSLNLAYSQGISGFRWDGNATFHPYDSTTTQSKTFYCADFSHSLNFENSNDINVRLRNFNTSLLNKSEQLFVNKADTYTGNFNYYENDVVFYTGNHEYYYCINDNNNIAPVQENIEWTRESGLFSNINTGYWTQDFNWKPSIGLSVDQKIRINNVSFDGKYTQIYQDGINESLLNLDLQFNNRDDEEAYAMLHFLEQKMGCKPFVFKAPSPYDSVKNFVCQEWSHSYVHKNNHNITARFEEFPFNLQADQYSNLVTEPILNSGELVFTSPFAFSKKDSEEDIGFGQIIKGRILLKNIGDSPIDLYNASVAARTIGSFSMIGQNGSNVPAVVGSDLEKSDYIFDLPVNEPSISDPSVDFDLKGKKIKLSKSYSAGIRGGQSFTVVTGSAGNYRPEKINGRVNSFFQNNVGQIKSTLSSSQKFFDCDYFVVEEFFKNNTVTQIAGGGEAFVDVLFGGIQQSEVSFEILTDQDVGINDTDNASSTIDSLEIIKLGGYYYGDLVVSSSTDYSPQTASLKVYIDY
jgi:phage-related protein